MIGLDTDVLVRYIVQDDPGKSRLAGEVIESRSGRDRAYVDLVTLMEAFWVLVKIYRFERHQISQVLHVLMGVGTIELQEPDVVRRAVEAFDNGADFADAIIAESNRRAGCEYTVTFDVAASEQLSMKLLK